MAGIFMADYLAGKKDLAAKVFTVKTNIRPMFQDAFNNKGGNYEFASMEDLVYFFIDEVNETKRDMPSKK
jgi:hypothetical protein